MKIPQLLEVNIPNSDIVQTHQHHDSLGFHLRLKNLLSEYESNYESELEGVIVQNPIDSLLASFNTVENIDSQWIPHLTEIENEYESVLFKLIDVQYGEWENVIQEILTALHEEKLIEVDVPLVEQEEKKDFITEAIQLFQMLLEIKPDWIEKLPIRQLSDVIKIGREVQQLPYLIQTTFMEMNQLDELKNSLQQLFSRLQKMENEQKFQDVLNQFKSAVSINEKQVSLPMYKQYISPPVLDQVQQINDQTGIDQVSANLKIPTSVNNQHYQLYLPIEDGGDVKAHTLLREFSNILSRAKLHTNFNTNRLFIKLYPEHLGTLQVELLQKNGVMTARLIASSNMAKNMLTSQLDSLKNAFSQQQITIDRVEVSYSEVDIPKYTKQNAQDSHHQSEQNQHEKLEKNDEDTMNFKDTFSDILLDLEV